MNHRYSVPTLKSLHKAEIQLPGSKSLTLRDVVLAALARGESTLHGWAECDDVDRMREALTVLGITLRQQGDGSLRVHGQGGTFARGTKEVSLGLSGVSARFLLALAALRDDVTLIDGDPPLRARPLAYLSESLHILGTSIVGAHAGYLPLQVQGGTITADHIKMKGDISSQYFSAMLLIAPYCRNGLTIEVEGELVSKPYLDMTIREMNKFGVTVGVNDDYSSFSIAPQSYQPTKCVVEADASAASYFLMLATVLGGSITLPRLGRGSIQGDLAFTRVCEALGAVVTLHDERVEIEGPPQGTLRCLKNPIDFNEMPDVAPTLMAIAPLIPGTTRLEGLSTLRMKECDRIAAPATELRKLGVTVREGPDWMEIDHHPTLRAALRDPVEIATYHDHRIAMSFGVLGSVINGVNICDPKVVEKTFPLFWDELRNVGARGRQ